MSCSICGLSAKGLIKVEVDTLLQWFCSKCFKDLKVDHAKKC